MGLIQNDSDFIAISENLIDNHLFDDAILLLKESLAKIPDDWKPHNESADFINIYFWNEQEFKSFVEYNRIIINKVVYWRFPSYSKGYYLLAYILSEQNNYKEALVEIEKGLRLEPNHPRLLCEKAFILGKIGDDLASLEHLEKASKSRPWNTLAQKTHSLREQSVVLTNLNRLDEAEAVLNEAILLNPKDQKLSEDIIIIKLLKLEQKNASIKVESEVHERLQQDIYQIFQEKGEEGVKEWLNKMNEK